jgi:fluoride exporter
MLWYIAFGSALGGMSRYLLGGVVQRLFETTFPSGTLLINVSGSFLLGAIIRFAVETSAISPEVRAFLTIGFCGGYTTFSTFSYETAAMMEDGEWTRVALYVVGSVGLSLAATFCGFTLARAALGARSG